MTELQVYYPTGQNYSVELMFAKFATAKSQNIKPTKTYYQHVIVYLYYTEYDKQVNHCISQLRIEPAISRFQVEHSTTELCRLALHKSWKNT